MISAIETATLSTATSMVARHGGRIDAAVREQHGCGLKGDGGGSAGLAAHWAVQPSSAHYKRVRERDVTNRISYPTVDLALREVTDSLAFERSSYYVLREQYPTLRITAPTADGGKDLRVAPLGSERDDVRVMVSIEGAWNRKLDAELRKIEKLGASERPADALFVTNQNATETAIGLRKKRALELGVRLEVMGHAQLVTALDEPRLRWVAELGLTSSR